MAGDAFAGAGYATAAFGKWHNGEYGPYHPNHRGFQEFLGVCRGAWENYFDAVIERNGKAIQTEGYITDKVPRSNSPSLVRVATSVDSNSSRNTTIRRD